MIKRIKPDGKCAFRVKEGVDVGLTGIKRGRAYERMIPPTVTSLPLKRSTVPMLQRAPCFSCSSDGGMQWPNMQKVLLLSDDRLDFLGKV